MDLNDAIRHAVELDAFNSAEQRLQESKGYLREAKSAEDSKQDDSITALIKAVQDIKEEMKILKLEMTKPKPAKSSSVICNFCKRKGHIKRYCFKYQESLGANPVVKQPKTGQREEKSNDKTKDASSRTGVSRKAGEAGILMMPPSMDIR